MKTTGNRLAIFTLTVFISCSLRANTYYLASRGGADGSPPYPMDPSKGTLPLTEVGDGQYVVEDSSGESFRSSRFIAMASIDPDDSGTNSSNGLQSPAPHVRNYTKYGGQIFSVLDTNDLASGTDTNLYNACAAIPPDTNMAAVLIIQPYEIGRAHV